MTEPQDGTTRRVSIAGRRYRLAGDPADSYFQDAPRHAKGVWAMQAVAAALLPPDGVAVDVEGFESEVLEGATAAIARYRPAFILEFNAWTILCNRNRNPREVLEDWLSRFPVVHAIRGAAPPERITPDDALAFLHDHLVRRRCMDDLVLGFDADWVARWKPPPSAGRRRSG